MSDPTPLVDHAVASLAELERSDLRRYITVLESMPGPRVNVDGDELLLMCSNNYLGLATDARLTDAAVKAAREWGVGSGASRLVSGSTQLHHDLERRIARLKRHEDAVLFSSGYLANIGTIDALVGPGDTVVSDELNHASIIDGCRMSGASIRVYPHCDVDAAEKLVRDAARSGRVLVVTDTVFSMDGDRAPIGALADLTHDHGAFLMVDDAHGTGVVETPSGVDILMGTCSKALGSAGGFVAASHQVCELLRNRVRSFIFDTAPPPPVVAATLAAIDVIEAEPERAERVRAHTRRLADSIGALGYDVGRPVAAIVPVIIGEAADALRVGATIRAQGVFAPPIRPPSVPRGTARIRLCPMATHSEADVDAVVDAFAVARDV